MTRLTGDLLELYCSGLLTVKKKPDDEDDAAGVVSGGIVLPSSNPVPAGVSPTFRAYSQAPDCIQ
eukprot:COSAG02_NODE_5388_length_4373_cov_9.024801_4_plen_65_part_00